MRDELLFAASHLHAAGPHGGEVRAPRDEDDVLATVREMRSEQPTDCTRPDDRDGQFRLKLSATFLRWILPVAVRGMRSTM